MVWFVVGIILFVVTLLGFLACLALWVYHDAKAKSNLSPLIWVLLVVFIPNLIGFIVYLLVGRPNKSVSAPAKYKWLAIISAVLFAFGTAVFVFGTVKLAYADFYGEYGARQYGLFLAYDDAVKNGVWNISSQYAEGYARITLNFSAEELENFYITAAYGGGEIYIRLEQNEESEVFELYDGFNGRIDLRNFAPGRITVYAEFENAEDVNIAVKWR